jgi:hypothetical protein
MEKMTQGSSREQLISEKVLPSVLLVEVVFSSYGNYIFFNNMVYIDFIRKFTIEVQYS